MNQPAPGPCCSIGGVGVQPLGLAASGLPAHASTHENGGADELSVDGLAGVLAAAQPTMIRANGGADQGPQPRINVIEGVGILVTAVNDPGNNEVDVTIAASGAAVTQALILPVRKASAGTIAAGTPLRVVSWNAGLGVLEVEAADAAASVSMPAVAMHNATITNAATSYPISNGVLGGLDTATGGWAVHDSIYVASGGGVTNVRPTGATTRVQRLGEVLRVHATLGEILLQGAGRSNDVPNIASGMVWEGNGSGVATEVDPDGRFDPAAHASDHQPGGADAMAVDAAAGTGSLRTIGTAALQACAGNDSRLSDDRTASGLRSASSVVSCSAATAPTSGQVLTATGSAAATWQTPSAGGSGVLGTMFFGMCDTANVNLANGDVYMGWLTPVADFEVNNARVSITQADIGYDVQLAIYTFSGTTATRVALSDTQDCDSTGLRTFTFSGGYTLTAGTIYYVGAVQTGIASGNCGLAGASVQSQNNPEYGCARLASSGSHPVSGTVLPQNTLPWIELY